LRLPGSALAGVGVASGADGDPLGKPPNEVERILRIGIDVQANEVVTTKANDRAHLVFLDGSALTVGPNARLVIDKFVYDPNTQTGELAVNASVGVLRLVGGKISKKTPITITTPSSTIGIRGGITVVNVTSGQTKAFFAFGTSLTMSSGGITKTVYQPGWTVTAYLGGAPLSPTKATSADMGLGQLEGTGGGSSGGDKSADQKSQSSGFSSKNSGQPTGTLNYNPNAGLPPNSNNNTLTNAISNSNPASQPVGNSTLTNPNNSTLTNAISNSSPASQPVGTSTS